jgi:transposase InsO family protein
MRGLYAAAVAFLARPSRRWMRRFQEAGEVGLIDQSRRPQRSPRRKVFHKQRSLILRLRRERNLGARRIQIELWLHWEIDLSITAIHKVLRQAQVKPLTRPRRVTHPKRYSRPVPGDRIQMDTMKIATGLYQYTAIDDCSRFRVLGLYPRRTAKYTIEFLERVIEEMPFSIQRIQTDRGSEFFAESVQRWMADHCIKFRPIAPRSPHLNGKVERSQLTDLQEFWPRFKAEDPQIAQRIEEWQFGYNWRRGHGSLKGKTPAEWSGRFADQVPLWEEVEANYDASKERLQLMHWKADQRLAN